MPTITKEKTQELITSFGKNTADTGNAQVQVALLTERIKNLTEHIKVNKKDRHSTLGLTKMVSQRKRLLAYCSKTNLSAYRELIKSLGLRK